MPIKERKLTNGKKVFDIRVQYSNMRISRSVPTTLTDAKRVESRLLQELIHGRYDILNNKQNPKFSLYAEAYKKTVTWQKSYRCTVLNVNQLVKFFGKKRLTEITQQDFMSYRALRLKKVSMASVNREHSCLLRMINLALKNDQFLINRNPLEGIKRFKEPPAENRILALEEYHKLLEFAVDYFHRIVFFACNTGMRKMEILNLKFGQIRMFLTGAAEIELIDTKSGDKEYVPLNEEVIEMLIMIGRERNIDLERISIEDRKKYVFTGMRGQRLQSVRKPMVNTFKKAGIELRPFHTFRHFWTKMMFESGVDPYTIQKVGRWPDFETMLKYCYTTRAQEHEAVNMLSHKLSKKEAKVLKMRQYNGNNE